LGVALNGNGTSTSTVMDACTGDILGTGRSAQIKEQKK